MVTLGDQPFFLALRFSLGDVPLGSGVRVTAMPWCAGEVSARPPLGTFRRPSGTANHFTRWCRRVANTQLRFARMRGVAHHTLSPRAFSLRAAAVTSNNRALSSLFLSSTQVVTRVAPNHFFGSYALSARMGSSIDHLWRRGGVGSLTPPTRPPTAGAQTFWRHWLLYLLSSTLVLGSWVPVLGSS